MSEEATDPLDEIAKRYEAALSGDLGPKERFKAVNEIADSAARGAINRIMFTGADGEAITGFDGMFSLPSPKRRSFRGSGGDGGSGEDGADGVDGEDGADGAQTACDGTCAAYYS